MFALVGVGLPTAAAAEETAAAEGDGSGAESGAGSLDRRQVLVLVGTVLALVGLGALASKIRAADPNTAASDALDEKLRRPDLAEGGEANNLLEGIIRVANRPSAYAGVLLGLFGLGTVLAVMRLDSLFAVVAFTFVLFAMMAFLRFGWPFIEALHGGADTSKPAGADTIRVGTPSTDSMVFLTLLVVITVLLLLGILIEASV